MVTSYTYTSDVIGVEPHLTGKCGRAWLAAPTADNPTILSSWIIECPSAHPLWHSYVLIGVHLRDLPGVKPATVYLPGATHEVNLFASDPGHSRSHAILGRARPYLLMPANYGTQFALASDGELRAKVAEIADMVVRGDLNPDTDNLQQWVELFGDSMIKKG